MCLFPLPNNDFKSLAFRKGVKEFDCGACPECLRKRSNVWALRCYYQAKTSQRACMITLTYDDYLRDDRGRIVGEKKPDPTLSVDKRHIQLFMKRLRKKFGSGIKYLACAEYGSRTHRAHYHCLLFGVDFSSDRHYYKKSNRGNVIYKSPTLTALWGHGICTIDCINVNTAVARYCTKYCAKSRSDNTFMLASQKIGFDGLMRDFNGRSYIIAGCEYPVPRFIWQSYITSKYQHICPDMDFRYLNRVKTDDPFFDQIDYRKNCFARSLYRAVRDSDPLYNSYLDYWRVKGSLFEQSMLTPVQRIYLLDDRKYHNYRIRALQCYAQRRAGAFTRAPGSRCISAEYRHRYQILGPMFDFGDKPTCPYPSRPNRASDTEDVNFNYFDPFNKEFLKIKRFKLLTFRFEQLKMLL